MNREVIGAVSIQCCSLNKVIYNYFLTFYDICSSRKFLNNLLQSVQAYCWLAKSINCDKRSHDSNHTADGSWNQLIKVCNSNYRKWSWLTQKNSEVLPFYPISIIIVLNNVFLNTCTIIQGMMSNYGPKTGLQMISTSFLI